MKRKIIIKAEIEVEELEKFVRTKLTKTKKVLGLILHILEFSFKGLLYLAFGDSIFERTQRTNKRVKNIKNGEYTAEMPNNTQQQQSPKPKPMGEGKYVDFVEVEDVEFSSTLRRCKNPNCTNTFEAKKNGNQVKKFCSQKCKDIVNNAKKMNNYYEQK